MKPSAPPPETIWRQGDDWCLIHPIPPDWAHAVGAYSARRRKSLDLIVGPPERREALLAEPIRPDRICAVVIDGEIAGCLSYRMDGTGATVPEPARYRSMFGLVGGTVRYAMTQATLIRGRRQDLYIEGFSIAPHARGRGLGRALLEWLTAEVLRHGKQGWRTEMPESHGDAARAYERFGARIVRRVPLGPAGFLLGTRALVLYRWTADGGDTTSSG